MTTTMPAPPLEAALVERSWRAIGTTVTLLVPGSAGADAAERILAARIDAIDRACSRFRLDSELQMVHAHAGRTVRVSPLLFEALEVACRVAERTGGAVDPTVGNAIATLGYDRDLSEVGNCPPVPPHALGPVVGFMHVQLNRAARTVRIPQGRPAGPRLGSSAKALVADQAAGPHRRRARHRRCS